jgi:hypothetical protein
MGKEREGVGERKASRKEQKTQAAVFDTVFSTATLAARQGGISTIMLGHLPFQNPC